MIDSPGPRRIIVPGIDGSGPSHWQSLLEDPSCVRIAPSSWSSPSLDDWLTALDRAVAAAGPEPVLVAHSLGTLLVAHWAGRAPIGAALLVAIPDPSAASFPVRAASFRAVPRDRLPFPSIVVASTSDPYDPDLAAASYASAWGSRFVEVGAAGHINVDSGHGPWPLAEALLGEFG